MDVEDDGSLDLAARAFAALWSVSVVFHFWSMVLMELSGALVLAAALWLFISGGHALAWAALSVGYLVMFWSNLPLIPAHEFASAIIHLIVLIAFGVCAGRARSWRVEGAELYRVMRPLLTIFISFLMGWAVIYKLNHSFFDVEESWAVKFQGNLAFNIRWLLFDATWVPEASWVKPFAPFLAILVEGFIAVGVLFRRTRGVAAAVLYLFFLSVGLSGVPGFASTVFALALVLLDARFLSACLRRARLFGRDGAMPRVHVVGVVAWLLSLASVRLGLILAPLAWFVPMLILFIRVRLKDRLLFGSGSTLRTPWPFWVVLLLLVVNELAPFAGWKDYPVMRMYSNARIDSCGNNHFFLPASERARGAVITTPETWTSFGHDFRAGRYIWPLNRDWLFFEVARRERSVWDPVTFGEVVAALARPLGVPHDQIQLVYERDGAVVREDLAALLRRERRHPFHRFFVKRAEDVEACSARALLPPDWPEITAP